MVAIPWAWRRTQSSRNNSLLFDRSESRVLFGNIPGHALREKGLERQISVGSLFSSKEQRALLVPVINRSSTARCVPPSVYIGFRLFVLLGRRSGDVSSMSRGVRGTLVSWAHCSVGVPSRPAPPRRPAVRPDPTRPWYVRVLDSTSWSITKDKWLVYFQAAPQLFETVVHQVFFCRIQNPDIPRAGPGEAPHGGARGRSGARQDGTPTGRSA